MKKEYVTVSYKYTGNIPNDYTIPNPVTVEKGSTYTVDFIPTNQTEVIGSDNILYIFNGWSQNGTIVVNSDIVITGNWNSYVDNKGTGTNPDSPDGIPDIYQIIVTFSAVGGNFTCSDGGNCSTVKRVLTKYDSEKNYSANGVATLKEEDIPTATANAGYGVGVWDHEPTVGLTISEDTTFKISFTQLPPVLPNPIIPTPTP